MTRRQADLHKLEQLISKSQKEAQKKLQQLCQEEFTCPLAAIEVAQRSGKKLKYCTLSDIQAVEFSVKLSKEQAIHGNSSRITYRIQANLERDESVIELKLRRAGRFVLATNVLDTHQLS